MVLFGNDERLGDSALRGGHVFVFVFQNSLHISAEMADLQNVDYLRMFFRILFGYYCERNINDSVLLLHFPLSKIRILDLLRFERVSSLFSASFFFSSFLLLCFSAALLSLCEAFTTDSFWPFVFAVSSLFSTYCFFSSFLLLCFSADFCRLASR